jgi:hypothetical protein
VTLGGFASRIGATFRTRAALGLRPITAPVLVFIPLGILLGPNVLGVLSPPVLGYFDVVVPIALATLGVFIGLALGREGRKARALVAAASTEALVTILTVAGAIMVLLTAWQVPLGIPYGLAALILGVCASASAAPAVEAAEDQAARIAARVADLDDVVPIVLSGVLIVMAGPGSRSAIGGLGLTIGLGLVAGVAGWLLIEEAEGDAERGVFVLGSLALLGGTAAHLGLSPLLTGMAAGWLWVVAPGECDRLMSSDLRKAQHPLVVLLLLTAGAGLQPTVIGVWLFAPYLVFRLAGKLIGGWIASRIAPGVAPSDLGAYLIPPGVIGIAFALNVQQVAPDSARSLVFAVACGAIASELLAAFLVPRQRSA